MNRQQNKTRKSIFNAFTELLSQKNYNKITVQDIIDLADIGRSTFYSHFETKDDLLKEICKEIFEHIFSNDLSRECTKKFKNENHNTETVITHILYHLKENKKNLITILTCESSYLFINYFKEYLYKVIDEFIIVNKNSENVPIDFLKNHISCSFVETVKWWIKNEMRENPEIISKYYLEVITPIL